MDELKIVDTRTTVNYLTLDSPIYNKTITVIPLPICMPNSEIITSTHMALLSKTDLPIKARKENIFQVSTKLCYQLELFVITDDKQYSMTINHSFSINVMGKY